MHVKQRVERALMLIFSACMIESGYAQSPETQNATEAKTEIDLGRTGKSDRDSIISLPSYLSSQSKFQGVNDVSKDFSTGQAKNFSTGQANDFSSTGLLEKNSATVNAKFNENHPQLGFYAYSKESVYLNLIDSRSATAGFYLKYYKLRFDVLLTANKYLGANNNPTANNFLTANNNLTAGTYAPTITNQFGLSGILQYDFSPNWSAAVWGSYYNVNPYYSMAALPFIQTSSYGGFLQYKGDKAGIKLGAQSYYDAFLRQWRTEPIVTPSINISKKVKLEFPVGSLIQQSLERAILQSRGNGPIIPPQRP